VIRVFIYQAVATVALIFAIHHISDPQGWRGLVFGGLWAALTVQCIGQSTLALKAASRKKVKQ
jgi:hypothetical protein